MKLVLLFVLVESYDVALKQPDQLHLPINRFPIKVCRSGKRFPSAGLVYPHSNEAQSDKENDT